MDGYDIVANYFKEWIESQSFRDRFYIAVFLGKRSGSITEPYKKFFELFEYDFDSEGSILWQIDWCEGENDIVNIRFYSLSDIKNFIIDAENHEPFNNCRKWYNVWR